MARSLIQPAGAKSNCLPSVSLLFPEPADQAGRTVTRSRLAFKLNSSRPASSPPRASAGLKTRIAKLQCSGCAVNLPSSFVQSKSRLLQTQYLQLQQTRKFVPKHGKSIVATGESISPNRIAIGQLFLLKLLAFCPFATGALAELPRFLGRLRHN